MALHEHVGFAHRVGLVVDLLSVQAQLCLRVHAGHVLRADEVLLCDGEHATCADSGIIDRADRAGLAQGFVVASENQVHHEADRIARGEVLTGGLVRAFIEGADEVLVHVAHLGVGDLRGVQIDLGEGLDHDVEQVFLCHVVDLVFKLKPREDVDVGGESSEVLDEVVLQAVGVAEEFFQGPGAGVEELQPGGATDLDLQ